MRRKFLVGVLVVFATTTAVLSSNAATVKPAKKGTGKSAIECVGTSTTALFAGTNPASPGLRIEAKQKVGKTLYRSVTTTRSDGTALLLGTDLGPGPVTVRVLPSGKAKKFIPSPTCTAPTASQGLMSFVSAVVKVVKTERAAIDIGVGVLVVPALSFKSALIKISKAAASLITDTTPSITGAIAIDTGTAKGQLLFETTVTKPPLPNGQPSITALFKPKTGPTIELPVGQNQLLVSVSLPGPGTIELIDRPSTLPPATPPTNTTPGQPKVVGALPASSLAPTGSAYAGAPRGQIVDWDGSDITVFNADGNSPLKKLTTAPAPDSFGAWSPDSSVIAFTAERDGQREIYRMNADGSGQKRLTNSGGEQPSWSPDGQTLAFVILSKSGGENGLWLMAPDGTNPRKIFSKGYFSSASWSPDGTKLVLAFEPDPKGPRELYLLNPDGSGLQQLTKDLAINDFPDWSSDGQRISYVIFSKVDAKFVGFGVINRDGTNPQAVKRVFWGQSCSLWARGGCGEDLNVAR
jgi:WD40-like Beta Propeller Repeat